MIIPVFLVVFAMNGIGYCIFYIIHVAISRLDYLAHIFCTTSEIWSPLDEWVWQPCLALDYYGQFGIAFENKVFTYEHDHSSLMTCTLVPFFWWHLRCLSWSEARQAPKLHPLLWRNRNGHCWCLASLLYWIFRLVHSRLECNIEDGFWYMLSYTGMRLTNISTNSVLLKSQPSEKTALIYLSKKCVTHFLQLVMGKMWAKNNDALINSLNSLYICKEINNKFLNSANFKYIYTLVPLGANFTHSLAPLGNQINFSHWNKCKSNQSVHRPQRHSNL